MRMLKLVNHSAEDDALKHELCDGSAWFISGHRLGKCSFLFPQLDYRRFRSATDAIPLPEPEPRAMREHFVVPSIGSRDVACAEWPNIRRFEHFL